MFLTKLKFAAAALLLIATGSAVLVSQATAQKPTARSGAVEKPGRTAAARRLPFADDAIDLEMLERAWVDALNRRDAAVVSRIMADDFAGIDSAGTTFTRDGLLARCPQWRLSR